MLVKEKNNISALEKSSELSFSHLEVYKQSVNWCLLALSNVWAVVTFKACKELMFQNISANYSKSNRLVIFFEKSNLLCFRLKLMITACPEQVRFWRYLAKTNFNDNRLSLPW